VQKYSRQETHEIKYWNLTFFLIYNNIYKLLFTNDFRDKQGGVLKYNNGGTVPPIPSTG